VQKGLQYTHAANKTAQGDKPSSSHRHGSWKRSKPTQQAINVGAGWTGVQWMWVRGS